MENEQANLEVAKAYVKAVCSGDFVKTRSVLHDNLSFKSVSGTHSSADSFIENLKNSIGQIAGGHEFKKEMVVGDRVVLSYDFLTKTPVGAIPCTEWFEVKNGKVASIELFFDPRPLMDLLK